MTARTRIGGQAAGLIHSDHSLPANVRAVAVISGKGGVGKTLLSVNLALALAEMGYETLLLDGDLTLANASILLGQLPEFGLEDVARGSCSLAQATTKVETRLRLITSGQERTYFAPSPGKFVGRLLHHFRSWDQDTDFVIIDTAAGAAEDVVLWALAANELIVIITPEPTSMTDAYLLCKVLQRTGFEGRIGVVVNMAASLESRQVFGAFSRLLSKYLDVEAVLLGNLPQDSAVPRAVRTQRPILRSSPGSPASRSLLKLSQSIVEWNPAKAYSSVPEVIGAWIRRLVRFELHESGL
jgi:flagellar biosynthesis protein FlhG